MQAKSSHDSIRHGLITMLPRLKRFADVLVGERRDGTALWIRIMGRAIRNRRGETVGGVIALVESRERANDLVGDYAFLDSWFEAGDEVDLFEHPNQQRYPGQGQYFKPQVVIYSITRK